MSTFYTDFPPPFMSPLVQNLFQVFYCKRTPPPPPPPPPVYNKRGPLATLNIPLKESEKGGENTNELLIMHQSPSK